MLVVRPAVSPGEVDAARALFREYAAGLGRDLSFQRFAEEVAQLPGPYAEPEGRLLLAWVDGAVAGCVALRPLEGQACELKRLYVRPGYRGEGIGERLVRRALDEALTAGHRRIRLDTLPSMRAAQALYRRLGFREISPYYATPIEGTVFFERTLEPPSV
ncbi:MAG TPA: GNAT family N-acetyltransferase [Gemmatimonadales bacterium]|jgi:ribosomal protein S18 acetylase RimI-like enzyme|nr:GNAT family N-acetyltransferase [Gemmatimonadales bacterium]